MCRFALIKSPKPIKPQEYISAFATMAKNSKTYDGDWQGDGWGVAWLEGNNKWNVYKSLKPVWEDKAAYSSVPSANYFVMHARAASFAEHKGDVSFNQPYIDGKYSFAFNGLLRGVKLPSGLEGRIGAEKIWSLLKRFLEKFPPEVALEKLKNTLQNVSESIQALNIGLSDGNNIYSLNVFSVNPEYYTLRFATIDGVSVIVSEPLTGASFQSLPCNQSVFIL